MLAPVLPFLTDDLWRNLVQDGPESVHPRPLARGGRARTAALLDEVAEVRTVVTLGRKARDEARLKHRQPLRRLVVAGAPRAKAHADEIAEELRVREVEFGEVEASELRVKPNLPVLGPEARRRAARGARAAAAGRVHGAGGRPVRGRRARARARGGARRARRPRGWSVVSESGVTVALDTALDDDLLLEGRLLDLIHTVNVLRKESGLDVTDRIRLVAPDEDVVRVYATDSPAETLAVSVEVGELGLEKV